MEQKWSSYYQCSWDVDLPDGNRTTLYYGLIRAIKKEGTLIVHLLISTAQRQFYCASGLARYPPPYALELALTNTSKEANTIIKEVLAHLRFLPPLWRPNAITVRLGHLLLHFVESNRLWHLLPRPLLKTARKTMSSQIHPSQIDEAYTSSIHLPTLYIAVLYVDN